MVVDQMEGFHHCHRHVPSDHALAVHISWHITPRQVPACSATDSCWDGKPYSASVRCAPPSRDTKTCHGRPSRCAASICSGSRWGWWRPYSGLACKQSSILEGVPQIYNEGPPPPPPPVRANPQTIISHRFLQSFVVCDRREIGTMPSLERTMSSMSLAIGKPRS